VVTFNPLFTSGTLSVNANTSCGSSGLRSISLNRVTITPANLVGSTFVCGLSSATYTATAVSGATGYTWSLPAGVSSGGVYSSVTTIGTSLPVAFDAGFTSGALSVVSNSPSCGSSSPKTITISRAPLTPATLSGSTNICNLSSATYTVSATANAVSYTWTLPTGVTSGGLTTVTIPAAIAPATNTITVNFAGLVPASGVISVTANSSCLLSSAPKTLTLTGVTAPATPTAIAGSTVVCASGTYTATAVVGAISYDWTLPTGVTSGGTGGVVNTTSNSITLDFDVAFVSGSSIAVKANNHCATSAVARTLALTRVIGTAGVITGPTEVCGLDSATYTVAATVGAVSYTWTLPTATGMTHWSGTYPVVTVSNTITVVFGTFTSGSLSVKANSACGATSVTARTLAISTGIGTAGVISGQTVVCGISSTTYTVAATAGAVSYIWTLPSGVTSPSGVSPVTITTGSTIDVIFAAGFSAGTLSVKAKNACGNISGTARTLAISRLAATPGVITGTTNVCGVSNATYTVVPVAGATGYKWTVPAELTILSGQGTNSIYVSISSGPGSTVFSSIVSVKDTNECGASAARSLTLSNCHSYSAFSSDNSDVSTVETSLYPNPTEGNFNVEYTSEINSELIIEMYDVLGKLVFSELETIVEGENTFRYNQGDLQKGSYFIRLTDQKNNINETKILIIQ
jgi:hypothetical protein